jgi:hypothetical protein
MDWGALHTHYNTNKRRRKGNKAYAAFSKARWMGEGWHMDQQEMLSSILARTDKGIGGSDLCDIC